MSRIDSFAKGRGQLSDKQSVSNRPTTEMNAELWLYVGDANLLDRVTGLLGADARTHGRIAITSSDLKDLSAQLSSADRCKVLVAEGDSAFLAESRTLEQLRWN